MKDRVRKFLTDFDIQFEEQEDSFFLPKLNFSFPVDKLPELTGIQWALLSVEVAEKVIVDLQQDLNQCEGALIIEGKFGA